MGNLARLPTCNNRPGHEIPDTPVDQRSFQEARPYIKEIPDPKGSMHQKIKKIWVIDQEAIDRTVYRLGWLNIKSNVIEDASVAIELYRLRE